jgi:hypothetical protein
VNALLTCPFSADHAQRQKSTKTLRTAFFVLILLHTGGDLAVDTTDPAVQFVIGMMPRSTLLGHADPTPCFIRGQLGFILRDLARRWFQSVVDELQLLALSQDCSQWPVVLSIFAVLLMAMETIEYHVGKVGCHAEYDGNVENSPAFLHHTMCQVLDEEGVDKLLHFYRMCYGKCHARLLDANASHSGDSTGIFLDSMREEVSNASAYLHERSKLSVGEMDSLSCFFDRLLGKLFLLPPLK